MMTRRRLLITSALAAALLAIHGTGAALAAGPAPAAFIDQTGRELSEVVNGSGSVEQRKAALQTIVDRVVDVTDVARFCLGRFWRLATPQQQKDYTTLFHEVLVRNITGKVGDYKGVTFVVGRALPREGDTVVTSVVTRPGNPPNKVDWLVSSASGSPKIIDVIAEGTSLRLTQRNDYTSYLQRNNNNVQALIDAMRQQANAPA